MSKEKNRFLEAIRSLLGSDQKNQEQQASPPEIEKPEPTPAAPARRPKLPYNKDYEPTRRLFLWGRDKQDNPSFAILYGLQDYHSGKDRENYLDDNVKYTHYVVFSGKEGHFPSFESVQIDDHYNYKTQKRSKKMYYRKDIREYTYWELQESAQPLKDFHALKKDIGIELPYYEIVSHEYYIARLRKENIVLQNFTPAQSPAEILKLSSALAPYEPLMIELYSNPKIYLRKKYLKQLMDLNPPKELYHFLLRTGSSELISGLFLELAKTGSDLLLEEAKPYTDTLVSWVSESYAKGLKRCAALYCTSFDPVKKEARIRLLRESLPGMDLHLRKKNGKDLPEGTILEGADYRQLADQGLLRLYTYEYSSQEHKYLRQKRLGLYDQTYYCDNGSLDIVKLKNTIQESEIYGLADVLGKTAYYTDAPRLTYYCKGNNRYKALMYLRKSIRRILDGYARTDEAKFIESMKVLFTSYTEIDYLSQYRGNFQLNYFIKHFLYDGFEEKAPYGWTERFEWFRDDQLLKLEGRYEFMPEVWDRHLEDVIAIAIDTKVETIAKALYYILKAPANLMKITAEMPYKMLIRGADSFYQPTADLFISIIEQRLAEERTFDPVLMFDLLESLNKRVQAAASSYFTRTGGSFSPEHLAGFLSGLNMENWTELLEEGLNRLNPAQYLTFIQAIFDDLPKLTALKEGWPEALKEILYQSLERTRQFSPAERVSLTIAVIESLNKPEALPEFLLEFMEMILFTASYPEMQELLKHPEINIEIHTHAQKSRMMLALLNAIKDNLLPADSMIMELLKSASAKMLRMLIEHLIAGQEQLATRSSTLLLLLESDAAALNVLAKSVFDSLSGAEQKKLHGMILDSPEPKVYTYGLEKLDELYDGTDGRFIPGEFVIQMMEHPAPEVKQYISDKVTAVILGMGQGNQELFLYYVKTLLFLPNKIAVGKKNIYDILPDFVRKHGDRQTEIEEILLELGCSNIISDSERALVALAKIKKEAVSFEG